MKWIRSIDSLPEPGDVVWILLKHWKMNHPQSCEIYGGEVCENANGEVYVCNCDYLGQGSRDWVFSPTTFGSDDVIVAWAHYAEGDVPLDEAPSNGDHIKKTERYQYQQQILKAWGYEMDGDDYKYEWTQRVQFIETKKLLPKKREIVVAVGKTGTPYIVLYEPDQALEEWKIPQNNEKITHWFPLPQFI